ncbi:MAG: Eco57I restriction-modification methylase domain-containing protein [Anaerolineae bacterium]|nr:Eco57I restriction-modification methylase domain-containing protein [Anaerolineae bacterium]
MPTTTERVYDILSSIQRTPGLDLIKRLFWTELNYDRAGAPVSTRGWPEAATGALAGEPLRLAEHTGFHVIYCRLKDRLLITPQRPVIERLLDEYPYALYIFSDFEQVHWHLVNVKYDPKVRARRLFRRITLGPLERLRTAAERIAMLDLASISPDLFGLSPLAIQARCDEAFDVEAVTRAFFQTYRAVFEFAEAQIAGIAGADARRMFTQRLFNRLMFIIFLERKGWLEFGGERAEYLRALWEDHRRSRRDLNFYAERLKTLFFAGLNQGADIVIPEIGRTPYLNGGLFEKAAGGADDDPNIAVPDAVIERAIDELFYRYNFTVTESTPLDVEVAVDPEMLGKIFEELVTGRHESGSYYTPKPVVSFMGREALKGYLQTACPREDAGALARFVDEHDSDAIRDAECVYQALRRVTICDPACGSGAYLLGMMRELFDLRLTLFHARGLDPVTAYERKLEIIQTNLYGVDIDPFAVNIARLRLWLSLIVEFETDDIKQVPALPNLDFKIEAGDSILGPDPSGAAAAAGFQDHLVNEFVRLKGEYMRERNHGVKAGLRAQVENVRAQIAEWAGGASDNGFNWALEFAEVFMDGGFDVVITNPPYVRQELIKDIKPALKRVYGNGLYSGTADLYVYFYYRARQLLKPGGVIDFISSNKWMRAGYGEKLRAHLAQTTALQTIVDFGDLPIFTATAYPCIVIVRKAEKPPEDHTFKALNVDEMEAVERIGEEVAAQAWMQPQTSLRDDGWVLVKSAIATLMVKLRKTGKPLNEYVNDNFFYGIKTGYNEAFIVDKQVRDLLIARDSKSAEIIKPWLRGKDVSRWQVRWEGLYVLYIPWGLDIEAYPAVLAHMQKYKKDLERRPGGYPWYALSRYASEYIDEFDQPKIVWRAVAKEAQGFGYDTSGALSADTTYFLPTRELFLLAILNSPVAALFLDQICDHVQANYLRVKSIYVSQIPIPTPAPAQRAAIESIVQKLLDLEGQGPDVPALEAELNRLVYEVYGLAAEEIRLIEETVG